MILEPPIWATNSWVADVWADGTWGIVIVPPHGEGGISVTLPAGWIDFSGGGSDPDLCGEDDDLGGIIPAMEIDHSGGAGGGSEPELSCIVGEHELTLEVSGGVPPFIWGVLGEEVSITQTALRTATISIAPPEALSLDDKIGSIHYFKAHAFSFSGGLNNPIAECEEPTPSHIQASVDVRLRAYDCMFRYIPEIADAGPNLDNIHPNDLNVGILDNPLGDDIADRSCTLAHDWPVSLGGNPSVPLSDPYGWSVDDSGCNADGEGGNVSVNVAATVAGKNGLHGTIHSGAPAFSETINIPMPFADLGNPGWFDPDTGQLYDIEGNNWIDVRTAEMLEAQCCLVPSGNDLTVTVIDAEDNIAVIIIPVVDVT